MTNGPLLLMYVTLQRLVELVIAQRNTRKLLARGAYEAGAAHYPVMIALHASWLLSLWALGWNRTLVPGFVALFVILQIGRFWVLRTLGERWTTRIIMTPWAAPVTAGPSASSAIRTTSSSRSNCRAFRSHSAWSGMRSCSAYSICS